MRFLWSEEVLVEVGDEVKIAAVGAMSCAGVEVTATATAMSGADGDVTA